MGKVVNALFGLGLALGFMLYLSKAIKPASSRGEKLYVIGISSGFLLFVILIIIALLGSFLSEPDKSVPVYLIPSVFLIPLAFIIVGVTQIKFANEAVELFKRRREQGKVSRWIVHGLPKRESFIMRGIGSLVVGLIYLVIFLFAIVSGFR